MSMKAKNLGLVGVGDTEIHSIAFTNPNSNDSYLASGELLTGTPTVVEISTTDLTLGDKAVNTTTITVDGISCIAGQAIQFTASGQQIGNLYQVLVTCSTDATPARTVARIVEFRCV